MKKRFLSMAMALTVAATSVVPAMAAEADFDAAEAAFEEVAEAVEADALGEAPELEADEAVEAGDAVISRQIVEGDETTWKADEKEHLPAVPAEWDPFGDPAAWTTASYGWVSNEYTVKEGDDEYTEHAEERWDSPFSYYFTKFGEDSNNHLTDGKTVAVNQSKNAKEQVGKRHTDDDSWFYKAIKVSDGVYILVKYGTGDDNGYYVWGNWDNSSDKPVYKSTVVNARYKGSEKESGEPVVEYNGYKHDWTGAKPKKGVSNDIFVDAVLVKKGTASGNDIVEGFSIKKVSFKNNVAATVPSEYVKVKSVDEEFDSLCTYESAAQLTKGENKSFKGQPCFTITGDFKGDAAAYKKDAAKALKAEVFNFEISRVNIGEPSMHMMGNSNSYLYDDNGSWLGYGNVFEYRFKYPATKFIDYDKREDAKEADLKAMQDEKDAAAAELEKQYNTFKADAEKALVNYYKTIRPELVVRVKVTEKKDGVETSKYVYKLSGSCSEDELKEYFKEKGYGVYCSYYNTVLKDEKEVKEFYVYYDEEEKEYYGRIRFNNVPFFANSAVDEAYAAQNNEISVSPTPYWIFDSVDLTVDSKGKQKLGINYAGKKVKIGSDIIAEDKATTDEAKTPFIVLKGANNFEGSVGMRNFNGAIRFGYYVDDTHYYINSVQ